MKIGVIGAGFVGGAVLQGFKLFVDEVRAYDVDQAKATHTLLEVLECDIAFVCLPTPMCKVEGGECDLSIIEGMFQHISSLEPKCLLVIKSTVPIGTTYLLKRRYPHLKIVHSPEFLTARTANVDFITPSRSIVGDPEPDTGNAWPLVNLYQKRFPGVPVLTMTSNESEAVKYFCNCFFATKIMFFNEMYALAEKLGLKWDRLLGGVMSDGRIAHSHFQVPGWDGDRGFGGTCFPKDLNALITTMKKHGIDPLVLKAVWEQNKVMRVDWDWAKSKSAVSQ